MGRTEIIYLVFGIVLSLALVFDLGIISKKNATITVKKALLQKIFITTKTLIPYATILKLM